MAWLPDMKVSRVQPLLDLVGLLAAAHGVDVAHGEIERLEPVRHVSHFVAVAHRDDPAIMDHQERGGADFDRVAGHGDDGSRGGGHAHHLHRHRLRVLAQHVVDGDAFEHVAAEGIDLHFDGAIADRAQLRGDLLRGDAAAGPIILADRSNMVMTLSPPATARTPADSTAHRSATSGRVKADTSRLPAPAARQGAPSRSPAAPGD
jgi:hypothetical protein